ncbi:MAG: GTP cyclohydrolase I FolE2, partial [Candidatus Pacearchaeota archaeon]
MELQEEETKNKIYINQVGIKNLVLPIKIKFGKNIVNTIGTFSSYTDLKANKRGIHMSRLVEILTNFSRKEIISPRSINNLLDEIRERLDKDISYLEISFILLKLKKSPITNKKSYLSYPCFIRVKKDKKNFLICIGTKVFVNTCCPISKSISKFGAHNQRGLITVKIFYKKRINIWFDEIISITEKEGSSEIYSLLKKEDEKYVTEKSYSNSKIVEDLIRDVASS